MLTVEERAQAVLAAVGQPVDTHAAGGRYRRSKAISPGVRYWATARLRQREDVFGVQFHGSAIAEAHRLRAAFERASFEIRNPETSKITYARQIPFRADEQVDAEAVAEAKRAADAILGTRATAASSTISFLDFMRASPLAGVELELPRRAMQAEDVADLAD